MLTVGYLTAEYFNEKKLPYVYRCHQFDQKWQEFLEEQINSVHSGSYGRLCWDEQAPTITTRFDTPAGGRFIHPTEDRTLTPREAARIQSFSDNFVFYGNKTSICKQIGNAVPPKISYFLARLVKNIMKAEEE